MTTARTVSDSRDNDDNDKDKNDDVSHVTRESPVAGDVTFPEDSFLNAGMYW